MNKQTDRRKMRPDNRKTLINATLHSIAEVGLIRTSVSEIIQRADLSRGMIHLHFGGKENLIVAAAEQASESYYNVLEDHIQSARPEPQYRIEAIILCDLGPVNLTEFNTRIWHELRGAVRAFPLLAAYSDTRDRRLRDMIESAYTAICQEAPAGQEQGEIKDRARDLTIATVAIIEGMWCDFLLHPQDFDRARAARIVFRTLAGFLPTHFDLNGARPGPE